MKQPVVPTAAKKNATVSKSDPLSIKQDAKQPLPPEKPKELNASNLSNKFNEMDQSSKTNHKQTASNLNAVTDSKDIENSKVSQQTTINDAKEIQADYV